MFIGIDIGGTFLKGAVLRPNEDLPLQVRRVLGPQPAASIDGRAEIDPYRLLTSVRQLCRQMCISSSSPLGILITGQMHGLCLTTSQLVPVLPIVSWRDRYPIQSEGHTWTQEEYIRSKLSSDQLRAMGNELRDGVPVGSIISRLEEMPSGSALVPHSLLSYVSHSLADKRGSEPVMHVTDAAAHGLLDIDRMQWADAAIEELEIGFLRWPQVTTSIAQVGFSTEFGCPVFVAVGDQQSALLGNGLQPNEISLNIATGSQVSRIVSSIQRDVQTRPYFQNGKLATVTHIPAGRALNTLVRLLAPGLEVDDDKFWSRIDRELQENPYTDLQLDLSFFPSATGRSGVIGNIREDNLDSRSIFAAAVESMVVTYARFVDLLDPDDEIDKIALSGGLTRRFTALREAIGRRFLHHSIRESIDDDSSLAGLKSLCQTLEYS